MISPLHVIVQRRRRRTAAVVADVEGECHVPAVHDHGSYSARSNARLCLWPLSVSCSTVVSSESQILMQIAEHAPGDRGEQHLAIKLALIRKLVARIGELPFAVHGVLDHLRHAVGHVRHAARLELCHRGYPVLTLTERRAGVAGGNGGTGIIGVTGMPAQVSPGCVCCEKMLTSWLR